MAHLIAWDNAEKTVVLQQYLVGSSKDDLYELAKTSYTMLTTVSHPVHIIIDERHIHLLLNSADLHYLDKYVPSNQGAIIMIPPPDSIGYKKIMQNIGRSVAPKAFSEPYFVASLEDARLFLQHNFEVNYP